MTSSIQMHKWQKRYLPACYITSFLIIIVGFWMITWGDRIAVDSFLNIFLLAICLSLGTNLIFIWKYAPYLSKGKKFSEEIGLKRIAIYPTAIQIEGHDGKLMEMHQRRYWKDAFTFMWQDRQKVRDTLNQELPRDFGNLSKWLRDNETAIVVTTHAKMWRYWEGASEPYLKHKQNENIDPWVYFSLLDWWLSTFKTTGRLKWKRPGKESWKTYLLITKEDH